MAGGGRKDDGRTPAYRTEYGTGTSEVIGERREQRTGSARGSFRTGGTVRNGLGLELVKKGCIMCKAGKVRKAGKSE